MIDSIHSIPVHCETVECAMSAREANARARHIQHACVERMNAVVVTVLRGAVVSTARSSTENILNSKHLIMKQTGLLRTSTAQITI